MDCFSLSIIKRCTAARKLDLDLNKAEEEAASLYHQHRVLRRGLEEDHLSLSTDYSNTTFEGTGMEAAVASTRLAATVAPPPPPPPESIASYYSSLIVQVLVGFVLYSLTIWTIIGNIIVCIIVLTNRQLKQGGMSNFLIGNLALSDLLLGLTVLPFSATLSTFKTWLFGSPLLFTFYLSNMGCITNHSNP